ncbi:hypothetical protein [Streptomyces sp. NPDC055692]|uniref:hypothetical protein n=1 Tax=Streptomyces sp. NPDC055692 TaxID=3155683 RepID=UPI00342A39A4
MDGTAITIIILAIAGVVTVILYVLKGISDQLPDLFDSFRRARDAWKRLWEQPDEAAKPEDTEEQPDEAAKPEETQEPPPPVAVPADDEEPPAAA